YKKYNLKATVKGEKITNSKTIYYSKILQQGLSIDQYAVSGDEYSGGFSIAISNYSVKTIKYIWITTIAYNAVDDRIGTKTVQGVGPIEKNKTGTWKFESIYYSRVFHSLEISALKIQYMDGSIKTIFSADIRKI